MLDWWRVPLRIAIASALALALAAPAAAPAHNINTAAGHHAEDMVVHDKATEKRLNRGTRLRSATAADATAAAVAADPGQVGEWSQPVNWPVVGIHVALLPNGKVLAWDSVGHLATERFPVHDFTRATVYDPVMHTHANVNVDTSFNIFCAGFAHLRRDRPREPEHRGPGRLHALHCRRRGRPVRGEDGQRRFRAAATATPATAPAESAADRVAHLAG
jgi:hypothetical protein